MRPWIPIALIALSACEKGGLDALVPQVRIIDLEPEEGPITGGTPVTITGFGFDDSTVAWFGATPLPTTVVDDITLVITTPAAAEPGPVDVKVSSEFGSATAEGAFVYFDGSSTGPGTGSGTGTSTGTGTGTGAGEPGPARAPAPGAAREAGAARAPERAR